MTEQQIFYVKTGVANFINGRIYLHEALLRPENKAYHDYLLNHEKVHAAAHTEMHDKADMFWNEWEDMKISKRFFFKNIKFVLSTAGAWWQLLPVRIIRGSALKESILAYDLYTLFVWLAAAGFLWWLL